jgi:formylglycine-generating enzyme required for sulfatase activity
MAEIFISYSSEDRQRVIPLVKALEAHGWSVWWDRIIPPGKTFAKVIEEALEEAGCLIVLWTETSVQSDWVHNEAAEGARRRILIPALMDEVEIPFEFKRIQAADLVSWRGEPEHAGFKQLILAITELLGPPRVKGPAPGDEQQLVSSSARDSDSRTLDRTPPEEPGPVDAPPGIATPAGKGFAARKSTWIALAAVALAGAALLIRPEFLKFTGGSGEDPTTKTRIEFAVTEVKPQSADASAGTPPEPAAAVTAPASKAPAPVSEPPPREALPPQEKPAPPVAVAAVDPPAPAPGEVVPAVPKVSPEPVQPKTGIAPPGKPPVESPAPAAAPPRPEPQQPKPIRPKDRAAKPEAAAPDIKPAPARAKPEVPAVAAVPREAAPRKTISNKLGMEFAFVPAPAAPFTMGSRLGLEELVKRFGGSEALYKGEKPFRAVKIGRPFYLQTKPVTQGQWQRVMGDNPASFKDCGEECPVETISWDDARQFVAKLNQMEGAARYRLPSEAEWEYALRAGSDAEFHFGEDTARLGEFAWFASNSGNRTHPVGRKKPNAWGLFDMTGNVWEWVEDDWHPGYDGAPPDGSARVETQRASARVVRGGAWGVVARYCRSAARFYENPAARKPYVGLRLVMPAD